MIPHRVRNMALPEALVSMIRVVHALRQTEWSQGPPNSEEPFRAMSRNRNFSVSPKLTGLIQAHGCVEAEFPELPRAVHKKGRANQGQEQE